VGRCRLLRKAAFAGVVQYLSALWAGELWEPRDLRAVQNTSRNGSRNKREDECLEGWDAGWSNMQGSRAAAEEKQIPTQHKETSRTYWDRVSSPRSLVVLDQPARASQALALVFEMLLCGNRGGTSWVAQIGVVGGRCTGKRTGGDKSLARASASSQGRPGMLGYRCGT
jgi:hypothetical protein